MVTTLEHFWTTDDVWHVPTGWRQGRGAWGGMVAGQVIVAASGAVTAATGSELPVRSAHIAMLGAVPSGDVYVATTMLRAGSATAAVEVTIRADGDLLTRATVIFGRQRQATPVSAVAEADVEVPDPAAATFVPVGPPFAPEFTTQLRFAPVAGLPYSAANPMSAEGWISLPETATDRPTAAIFAALVDGWWTAALTGFGPEVMETGLPPLATLDFLATFPSSEEEVRQSLGADPWQVGLYHHGHILAGTDGYLTEVSSLHAPDGRLLVSNTQVVAVGRGL